MSILKSRLIDILFYLVCMESTKSVRECLLVNPKMSNGDVCYDIIYNNVYFF